MLTGDYLPTAGHAWIDGQDVVQEKRRVHARMGYCPQVAPLLTIMRALTWAWISQTVAIVSVCWSALMPISQADSMPLMV